MIINLTQHIGTAAQAVVEPRNKAEVQRLLTFSEAPTGTEINDRAKALAALAASETGACHYCGMTNCEYGRGAEPVCGCYGEPEYAAAMVGGAPYLMGPLDLALRAVGVRPVYSFSVRRSVDEPQPDGSVKKVAVFEHGGWVENY